MMKSKIVYSITDTTQSITTEHLRTNSTPSTNQPSFTALTSDDTTMNVEVTRDSKTQPGVMNGTESAVNKIHDTTIYIEVTDVSKNQPGVINDVGSAVGDSTGGKIMNHVLYMQLK